jgi:hypothetical protein
METPTHFLLVCFDLEKSLPWVLWQLTSVKTSLYQTGRSSLSSESKLESPLAQKFKVKFGSTPCLWLLLWLPSHATNESSIAHDNLSRSRCSRAWLSSSFESSSSLPAPRLELGVRVRRLTQSLPLAMAWWQRSGSHQRPDTCLRQALCLQSPFSPSLQNSPHSAII